MSEESSKNQVLVSDKFELTLTKKLKEHLKKNWRPLLFSAALSIIFEYLGLMTFLTKLSMMVVSNLATVDVGTVKYNSLNAPVVITIGDKDFEDRYLERTPLNRCVFKKDLDVILAKSPKAIGIDFDLSPENGASVEERACQAQLDKLIDDHAKNIVLLVPFRVRSQTLLDIKHKWMSARCRNGVNFADGTLSQSMGMVIDQNKDTPFRLAEMVRGSGNKEICESVLSVSEASRNPWLSMGRMNPLKVSVETVPINFNAFVSEVNGYFTVSSQRLGSINTLSGRPVFFGGTWGNDDNFQTPAGILPGVAIHAARYVSLEHPVKAMPRFWGLVADLVIAFMFSILIDYFWSLYVNLKEVESGKNEAMSSAILIAFLLIYTGLTIAFFVIAEYTFTSWGLLIAPLLISISMLSDGFITGPIDVFMEKIRSKDERNEKNKNLLIYKEMQNEQLVGSPYIYSCCLF